MPISRRQFGQGALGLAAAVPLASAVGPLAPEAFAAPAPGGNNAGRAALAYQAMQQFFYVPAQQLYHDPYPTSNPNSYSYVWPFSQAMVATFDLAAISGGYQADVQARLSGLERYWNPTPKSNNPPSPPAPPSPPGYASGVMSTGGGDLFYDDNDWIALAMVQRYYLTGDQAALAKAEALYKLVVYAWDSDPSHADPGGDFWTQASWSHDRNTISNAPGAELALHLYLIGGKQNADYLNVALQRYNWVNQYMLAPNGLYWDHTDLSGNVEKTQWSYNQGVMLGASALLYKATGDQRYLQRAQQIAQAALAFYGAGGRIFTQDVIFNAIFFKNLLLLDSIAPVAGVRAALQQYTDALWQEADQSSGLLEVQIYNGIPLLNQAGFTQLFALLAMQPDQYKLLA